MSRLCVVAGVSTLMLHCVTIALLAGFVSATTNKGKQHKKWRFLVVWGGVLHTQPVLIVLMWVCGVVHQWPCVPLQLVTTLHMFTTLHVFTASPPVVKFIKLTYHLRLHHLSLRGGASLGTASHHEMQSPPGTHVMRISTPANIAIWIDT